MRPTSPFTRCALALALLAPSLAIAEPTPQQIKAASEEFDRGVKAAQSGDLEGAAVHFENADREAPSDATLKAAIRARRDAKQPDRAATLAELALTRHPDKEELTTFARSVLVGADRSLAKVEITCKPACELAIDKKIVHGEAATRRVLWLVGGKHVVAAGWGAKGASKELTVTAGTTTQAAFAPAEEPKPAPAAAPPGASDAAEPEPAPAERPAPAKGGKLGPGLFIGGAVVTGALAAASIWSGLDTKNNPGPDKVKQVCAGKGDTCPEYRDGLAKQSRTNLLLGLTAGAAVATGVIGLVFTDWGSGDKAGRVVPVAVVGGGGATVGAVGRF
ncbi:MAG: hypothetical protein IT374_12270 [Polyangiaceae bacterium]|nr:hypothetical protein [Polyangiaceae bacterium]